MNKSIAQLVAAEIRVQEWQVQAAMDLLAEGATVPFVARYRKEKTGELDDIQLRAISERSTYLRDLGDMKASVLASIESQGKLDDGLRASIAAAETKQKVEDIYLPFRPKRRTKGEIAKEAGLEPLANLLLGNPSLTPDTEAMAFISTDKGINDAADALAGAKAILSERYADDGELLGQFRDEVWSKGRARVTVVQGKETEGAKFSDYFSHIEPLSKMAGHRALAVVRGERAGVLDFTIDPFDVDPIDPKAQNRFEKRIAMRAGIEDKGRPADKWLADTVRWAWRTKILPTISSDNRLRLMQNAEDEAIRVFAANLRDVLLSSPAGSRATLALDPGIRTGVKVAVVDAVGRVTDHTAVFPHEPRRQWTESIHVLAALCKKHDVELIAIGNGTASRETEKLVLDMLKAYPEIRAIKAIVSEAGASIYSASEFASRELPELDVTIRGAVSIGRRLQDPLAELVKIDPKSIGVGQYQHDVSEFKLAKALDAVVEDCVNGVGVDLNTASAPLLARVAGVGPSLAEAIVRHREANGPFKSRSNLLSVPGLGDKRFEQCAGFLRIRGGDALDNSAVHPEAYPLVHRIVEATGGELTSIIGNTKAIRSIVADAFVDERFGLITVKDVLAELEKPGRDPRPEFKTASFKDGVEEISDLKPGMILEGTVTNVANFGAFVDIGVHQDGLVHISAISEKFLKDPRDAVRSGQVVKVKVLSVDAPRKRIALTMRMSDEPSEDTPPMGGAPNRRNDRQRPAAPAANNAFAAAFAKAERK